MSRTVRATIAALFGYARFVAAFAIGLALVPFILTNIIGNPQLMQPDRAHPNAAGAQAMADAIWPHLERMLTGSVLASRP